MVIHYLHNIHSIVIEINMVRGKDCMKTFVKIEDSMQWKKVISKD